MALPKNLNDVVADHELDGETLRWALKVWVKTQAHHQDILMDFYERSSIKTTGILDGVNISDLITKQCHHLRELMLNGADQKYLENTLRIGHIHVRVGVQPTHLVGSYRFLMSRIVVELRKTEPESDDLIQMLESIFRLLMFDLDIQLYAYWDASNPGNGAV